MNTKVETLVVDADGSLRIPAELLERAHFVGGTVVEVAAGEDGFVAISAVDGADDEWHAGVLQAIREVEEGKTDFFASDEEFRAALLARMNRD